MFRDLARHFAPEYPFFALQSYGLNGSKKHLSTVEEMAAHYLAEIKEVQPQGPYYLGGFCMGGLIAYEMARTLVRQGERVALLAMIDSYNFDGVRLRPSMLARASQIKQRFGFHWQNLATLPLRGRLAYLREKTVGFRTRESQRVAAKLRALLNRVALRNAQDNRDVFVEDINDEAQFTYRPGRYPGKLTLIVPERNYTFIKDANMGWGGFAMGEIELKQWPVRPGGIFVEPYVRILAQHLKVHIDGEKSQGRM